jgi:hypothetical protein
MSNAAEFQETRDLVLKHEQTLYGETGDNGLRGRSKEHAARLDAHEQRFASIEKRIYVLCALFAAGGASAPELVKQFFAG